MQNIICFISDFGLEDTWVGVCHAVIYAACPQARVVDLAHHFPPFDIRKAAAVAAAGVYQLPEAIHLVVVDPGVGGGRDDICVVSRNGTRLVGPDNGVLIPAARRVGGIESVYAIEPVDVDSKPPLGTFHARDVLAPAAAALACGSSAASLGHPVDPSGLVAAPFQTCRPEGQDVISEIIDIDRFGSVRLGVGEEDVTALGLQGERLEISFGHSMLDVPFGGTFSDVGVSEPIGLVDSTGWLTLSVREGSAADKYGLELGAPARIRLSS